MLRNGTGEEIEGSTRGPRGPNKVKEKFQRGEGVIFNPKFILQILDLYTGL